MKKRKDGKERKYHFLFHFEYKKKVKKKEKERMSEEFGDYEESNQGMKNPRKMKNGVKKSWRDKMKYQSRKGKVGVEEEEKVEEVKKKWSGKDYKREESEEEEDEKEKVEENKIEEKDREED